MKVVVAGGGTGGHIYPAVAVLERLRTGVENLDVTFLGTRRGLEGGIVPRLGYSMRAIVSRPLPAIKNADFVFSLIAASVGFVQSLIIMMSNRPHVVIGTGGYASGPVVLAARVLGIPILLIEPNSVPGRTISLLSRYADEIDLGFKETVRYFERGTNLRVTGVPIRASLGGGRRAEGLERFGLAGDRKTVFVFGGSRGAESINRAVIEAARLLADRRDLQLLVQTGRDGYARVEESLKKLEMPSSVHAFIDDMRLAYAAADLVVCRSGASAVAEVTACGLPAILIPYPHATGGHQESNARLLEEAGAARVILDCDLDGDALARAIVSMITDPDLVRRMSDNSRRLGNPRAADEIASRLLDLARKKGRLRKLATALVDLCSVR
jgi:UDP-N-acetylglucosamine--N-acetylmuramyl-(pentapeptide) pyrophosphoryl-undecaprenol N-acetylglucosamine transferase